MQSLTRWILTLVLAGLLVGCDYFPHGHNADGSHLRGQVGDHGGAHDDHGGGDEGGHGHEPGAIAVTHFTAQTELFVEYPALIVGEQSAFAAHLTYLSDFTPVAAGTLSVRLSGGGAEEAFSVDAPSIPGIFRPLAIPTQAGERSLKLELNTPDLTVIHDLGTVTVYPDKHAAEAAREPEQDSNGEISLLKEQQWKVDFATAEVSTRGLRASIAATGIIRARSDGEALVSAPAAGHLLPGTAFPRLGTRVEAGDTLALIAPRVAGEVDVVSLELALQRARSALNLAAGERKRLADLVAQQAAPEKRLNEAKNAEHVARAELDAAEQRLKQYQRTLDASGSGKTSAITVRAPMAGILAEIRVAAGSFVQEGQAMFHLVETDRLWLEAKVAEADLGRLGTPSGAWFEVEGFAQTFEIKAADGGKLVAAGNVVDAVSRTAPFVFEFANTDHALRVGMFAQVHIWTGEAVESVALPVRALVDEAGQDVAYVMLGGESFERRVLRLGVREGGYVEVKSGIQAGERVVTRGAYLVRLAAASPAEAGHGHAH
jgi:membrane fusion protein, heavy metal efflux system